MNSRFTCSVRVAMKVKISLSKKVQPERRLRETKMSKRCARFWLATMHRTFVLKSLPGNRKARMRSMLAKPNLRTRLG